MAISRVEIKDFLLFKGEFGVDFCAGVNVLIGGNGTGKTTLMKVMYRLCNGGKNGGFRYTEEFFFAAGWKGMELTDRPFEHLRMQSVTNDSESRISVKSLTQSSLGEDEGGGDRVIEKGTWVLYRADEYTDEYTQAHAVIYGDTQKSCRRLTIPPHCDDFAELADTLTDAQRQ